MATTATQNILGLHEFGTPGEVPQKMKAWVIREERFGEPLKSFQEEEVDVPPLADDEILVRSVCSGVNYNGVWAGLGQPVSVLKVHGGDFHICGSDVSGIVWAVGKNVKSWKPGDAVICHCNYEDPQHGKRTESAGDFISYDPMASPKCQIWGYETTWGSFAQFCKVQAQQVLPKPKHMSWELASCYALTYFTAYRMLVVQGQIHPGEVALIWGGAGGLGSFAIQICRELGVKAIAVVSSDEKGEKCKELGAVGYINRKEYPNLAYRDDETPEQAKARFGDYKAVGKKIWEILGERRSPDIVFEHSGAQTFPASVFLCSRFGRVVICGATTGYNLMFDVRYLWMMQKRIIGSHFANALDCLRANTLLEDGRIQPFLSKVYPYDQIPQAHQDMYENKHIGNMTTMVMAPKEGLVTIEDLKSVCD